ncbi:MFS transporter [Kitasatospora sp. NPDC096147]|uniref:MFS transporter n=1 Tax=Kitasatospora sp. NPDC096147 TaxID=3364093 RepID=UPI003817799C
MKNHRFAWASRNYRVQTAATVIAGLGNAGAPIATAFAVLELGGGATEVGLVTGAHLASMVVFLLFGGALADRLPRHHVMVGANLFNAASQALLAVLVLTGTAELWQLIALSAAGGAGQAFYAPASEGMIMESIAKEHAARAFAVFRMALNGSQIGGAALGGVLVTAIGPGWVLAVDAAGFTVAAALRLLLDLEAPITPAERSSVVQALREGWREFTARRWLWVIVLQFSLVNACLGAVESVYGPVIAKERLGGADAWGLALAAFSAGLFLSGFLMVRWQPARVLLAGNHGVFLFAAPAYALALQAPLPVLCAAMFTSGLGITVFGVNWMVALQQEVPSELFSRVSAYDYFGSIALAPVGTALAGPVAELLGMREALWLCAVATTLLALAVLAERQIRTLRRTATAPAVAEEVTVSSA